MTISLSSVKYVGPAMQTRLESNGVNTVEQLAAMSEQDLADIPGVGASTAQGILESAKSLLAQTDASTDSAANPEPTTETNPEAANPTVNTSADFTISATGQLTNPADTLTLEGFFVEIV